MHRPSKNHNFRTIQDNNQLFPGEPGVNVLSPTTIFLKDKLHIAITRFFQTQYPKLYFFCRYMSCGIYLIFVRFFAKKNF